MMLFRRRSDLVFHGSSAEMTSWTLIWLRVLWSVGRSVFKVYWSINLPFTLAQHHNRLLQILTFPADSFNMGKNANKRIVCRLSGWTTVHYRQDKHNWSYRSFCVCLLFCFFKKKGMVPKTCTVLWHESMSGRACCREHVWWWRAAKKTKCRINYEIMVGFFF